MLGRVDNCDDIAGVTLHETMINRHLNDYLEKEKLAPENGGSNSYLSAEQTQEVIQHLSDKTYQFSYQIMDYIDARHHIRFSISGLNKWLHHHGFSYKKPKGVPHKFDPLKQAEFIEQYQALRTQVIDEPILFIHAMHPTQATKISAEELNIKLHYLPPYSPNSNPIERLWKVMNEHVRNNQYFSCAKEFREKIDAFFQNTLPEIGKRLESRINDDFQVLNPAA